MDALAATQSCHDEPIHQPDAIQPHGLMLVMDGALRVRRAAGAVEARLGIADWQGAPLSALVGDEIAALARAEGAHGYLGQLHRPDEILDASLWASGEWLAMELEPAPAQVEPAAALLGRLEAAARGFEHVASVQGLCDRAAHAFRQLTGFDHVMIYRFLDEEAGQVLAESRREGIRSFLNHHFPGTDIPRQARALYLRNLTRVIPDITYLPEPLRPDPSGASRLDMSDSALRSVSPVHLDYLRNMGVRASASISIVKDGLLWGLVACHHMTPRLMPYVIRCGARALAASLARQIKAKREAEGYRQRIRLRSFEDDTIQVLGREGSLDRALSNHLGEIGRIMGAQGVAVIRGEELVCGGSCPGNGAIRALAAWLAARRGDPVLATEQLELLHAPAAGFRETGSGLLAVTLSAEEPWLLLWFRAEQVQVVEWAGNPHRHASPDPAVALSPRASFETWRETTRGRASAWTAPEIETAGRLRNALLDLRQNRRMHDLNRRLTEILRDKDQLLKQKEFLVGEVNHRVQNSLQLVSSFLGLQIRGSEDPALRAALEEARRRLSAVALVHRRLYRGDQVQTVDAARYVEELCADTIDSMGREWQALLSMELSPVPLPTDRAVTLGLVLTELVININKYAYDGAAGPIGILLDEEPDRRFRLVVADRGVGRTSDRQGFGSRMMDALVGQLGGTLRYEDNEPGLRAVLSAPIGGMNTQA